MERLGTEAKTKAKKVSRPVQTQPSAEYTETMENTSIATTPETTTTPVPAPSDAGAFLQAAKEAMAALKAARAAERQKIREQRDLERAAKKAQREISRMVSPPHMAKVEKASKNLGELDGLVKQLFDQITMDLVPNQVEQLGQHLLAHARAKRTARSTNLRVLQVGDKVTIHGGDPRYHGMVGTVVVSNRLRVRVKVDAKNTPLYLFRADVKPVSDETDAGLSRRGGMAETGGSRKVPA